MTLEVEVLRSSAELVRVRDEWEALFAETPDASPYQCYEWIESEARHRESEGPSGLRVCVVRRAGQTLAILPFDVKQRWEIPFPHRELRWAGGGWGTRMTAILPERCRGVPVLEAALEALGDREWNYCRLDKVPRESPLLSRPPGARIHSRAVSHGRSIVIRLPTTWEAYRSGLSPSHRKNVSRRSNQLRRAGAVRLVRLGLRPNDTGGALETLMRDALSVSEKSWQGIPAAGGAAISAPKVVDLIRDVSRKLAARGRLDLSVLYLDAQPISFVWGTACLPRTSIAKLAFDPAFAALSPGLTHLALLIQDSIRRSVLEIDFGHEFPEYKNHWSRDGDELSLLFVYGESYRSRLLEAWKHRPDWSRRSYWRAAR
jgi:CelD/BcsL family acetyltransferase involved in cellulose biosynthesis